MAKLMKRNEDLEAEVAQLKEELKVKTREATESTQVGLGVHPGGWGGQNPMGKHAKMCGK